MRIWYDVSGLYGWHGNFTGIQRVVYNLANELNISGDPVHYFIYHSNGFKEITFHELEARLAQRKIENPRSAPDQHSRVTLAKVRHKGMVILKDSLRESRFSPQLKKAYKKLRKNYRSLKSPSAVRVMHIPFEENDTVVVVDGNWQFDDYAKQLVEAKAKRNFKLVHFVHDLVAVHNPALVNKGADKIIGDYFSAIFPFADSLLTISESTKRDVKKFITDKNIQTSASINTVILGDNIQGDEEMGSKMPESLSLQRFCLAVSTIEVRKNYLSIYYAYKLASQEGIELPHLVIVGKKGWMAGDVYNLLTTDPDVKERITLLQGIDDEELNWLYDNCLFTIFPSFYEGWGLPVAESFKHAKACISSNTSSMPEVGSDLAVYVSPYDTRQLMASIHTLASSDETRLALEKRIKQEYIGHSWSDTYTQFKDLITS